MGMSQSPLIILVAEFFATSRAWRVMTRGFFFLETVQHGLIFRDFMSPLSYSSLRPWILCWKLHFSYPTCILSNGGRQHLALYFMAGDWLAEADLKGALFVPLHWTYLKENFYLKKKKFVDALETTVGSFFANKGLLSFLLVVYLHDFLIIDNYLGDQHLIWDTRDGSKSGFYWPRESILTLRRNHAVGLRNLGHGVKWKIPQGVSFFSPHHSHFTLPVEVDSGLSRTKWQRQWPRRCGPHSHGSDPDGIIDGLP